MKTVSFLVLLLMMMIGALLLQSPSLASEANSVPQQTPSQGRETSDSSEGLKDGQVRGEENQPGAGDSDVRQNTFARGTRRRTQRRPNQSHAKPAPSHQLRSGNTQVANGLRSETLGNGLAFQRLGSLTSSGVPNKTGSRHIAPVSPATVAVNGRQFESSRDPGARPASIGGSLTAARGTAAINGTNMKRKPQLP